MLALTTCMVERFLCLDFVLTFFVSANNQDKNAYIFSWKFHENGKNVYYSFGLHEDVVINLYKTRIFEWQFIHFENGTNLIVFLDRLSPVDIKRVILVNNITTDKKALKSTFY